MPLGPGEQVELPEFQFQVQPAARRPGRAAGLPAGFEFMLNDVEGDTSISAPDPHIRRAWDRVRLPSARGLLVTAPEIQLLHKGRHHRPKDDHDFARVHPHLRRSRAPGCATPALIRPAILGWRSLNRRQTMDDRRYAHFNGPRKVACSSVSPVTALVCEGA